MKRSSLVVEHNEEDPLFERSTMKRSYLVRSTMKRSSLVEEHNEEELLGERSTMKRSSLVRGAQ